MTCCTQTDRMERLTLWGETAADLMTPNPVSIGADDTVGEAIAFLTDHGFGAAPVIDEAGRPVGVLSHSDIMVHDREMPESSPVMRRVLVGEELTNYTGDVVAERVLMEEIDETRVRDMMTPAVFSVLPSTPAPRIVAEMVALKVHQIYVVDGEGVLIGVISALDVMRHLGATDPRIATRT
jgi:CBS-domain-containing membrane protein